jgi:hypothetical protein
VSQATQTRLIIEAYVGQAWLTRAEYPHGGNNSPETAVPQFP